MFEVDLIVLNKVVVYIGRENWGDPWVGGRRRMGGGDARVPRLRSGLIRQ